MRSLINSVLIFSKETQGSRFVGVFFISSLKKRIKYFEGNESLNKKKQQHANHAEFSGLEEVIIKIEM